LAYKRFFSSAAVKTAREAVIDEEEAEDED